MKYFLIPIIGFLWGFAPLLAQDDDDDMLDMPTKEEILERVKRFIERDKHQWIDEHLPARNATYIRTRHITETGHEVERSTNNMSALTGLHYYYYPPFAHYPVEYKIVDGTATLWSLMYRVYPYMKDKLPKKIDYTEHMGLSVSCNLKKETLEASFRSSIGFEGVPMEVFERVEAEIFENGVRMEFNLKEFERRSCGSTGYAGGISFNPTRYKRELWHKVKSWYSERQYPQMGSGTDSSPLAKSHQGLLHQIIWANLRFSLGGRINWDKYTFRYYHPTIIYRLLVDVGTGGYTKIGDSKVAYREGKYSHLLLPDDSRYIADRSENTSLMTLKDERYYEVLLDPVHLAEMSPEQFGTELVSRLCQAYIAYELAIEGRIIPSVKAHLDAVNWYEGRFADLLAYYAEVKGLSLDALRTTYVREQKEILLRVLHDSEPRKLERLLWQTLGLNK